MSQLKIAVLVGSLRMDSFNRRLARAVEKLAPEDFAFKHLQLDDLPLYSQDFELNHGFNRNGATLVVIIMFLLLFPFLQQQRRNRPVAHGVFP